VFWLGVEASPALRCLKQDLEWALAECGFAREMRAFHPHITLGRSAAEGGGGIFRGLDDLVTRLSYQGRVTAGSVDLMSSQLNRQGPRYSILSSSQLDRGR
jgi:2'-5' RNA ligase